MIAPTALPIEGLRTLDGDLPVHPSHGYMVDPARYETHGFCGGCGGNLTEVACIGDEMAEACPEEPR